MTRPRHLLIRNFLSFLQGEDMNNYYEIKVKTNDESNH
jgi:hypothetical protein